MALTIGSLLALSFVISLIALLFLIWGITGGQFDVDQRDANIIFTADDAVNHKDRDHRFDTEAAGIDEVSRGPVRVLIASAVLWLVLGSIFGLISSLKMHWPDLLDQWAPLTFGRLRTLHLNAVAYGWSSLASLAAVMWLIPRIFHTPLRFPRLPLYGAVIWNAGLAAGLIAIALGWTDGLEWLEIPWQIDGALAVGGALFAIPLIASALSRQVNHIYVSGWYFIAALCWFPVLFIIANFPYVHSGAEQAAVNWWFAHNVLGLWLTPLGVGIAYYFIPKIIGKPIYSYSLSLVGFWGLALFYSQVGIHHLIGGPVPTWLVNVSIVHSVMMFLPVIAVAVNQHVTVANNLWALRDSYPLRFVWLGALMYTAASLQGSVEALRSVNTIAHFTHYTVGHAHLGVYGFVAFVLFGFVYEVGPKLVGRPWPWPALIPLHYWLVLVGFAIYFVALTVGGWLQGKAMLDALRPFADSVTLLKPYLEARSLGGTLMTLGHFIFAFHVAALFMQRAPQTLARTAA
jgi:cytochrome c oxidase cbb3-type subunit 1